MITIIICFVLLSIVGIIFLQGNATNMEQTREEFLENFAKLLEGSIEKIDDEALTCLIKFSFEGSDFEFEDIISSGFSMDIMKAYLKLKVPIEYSLSFEKHNKDYSVHSKMIALSELEETQNEKNYEIEKPKFLKDIDVITNDGLLTNDLLIDSKFQKLLKLYISYRDNGEPSIGFKIINGVLILEFSSLSNFQPSLGELKTELNSIEKHLFNLKYVSKIILKSLENVRDKDRPQ